MVRSAEHHGLMRCTCLQESLFEAPSTGLCGTSSGLLKRTGERGRAKQYAGRLSVYEQEKQARDHVRPAPEDWQLYQRLVRWLSA